MLGAWRRALLARPATGTVAARATVAVAAVASRGMATLMPSVRAVADQQPLRTAGKQQLSCSAAALTPSRAIIRRRVAMAMYDHSGATAEAAAAAAIAQPKFLTQKEAINVDVELFSKAYAFVSEQLMELAGLSVATCVERYYGALRAPNNGKPRALIVCGPGNNGGDGLIAARHLSQFGFAVTVVYPKPPKLDLFKNLMTQAKNVGAVVRDTLPSPIAGAFEVVLDAIFGYSFTGEVRAPYDAIIAALIALPKPPAGRALPVKAGATGAAAAGAGGAGVPIVSVDIPSGWNVETGPGDESKNPALRPEVLISLGAPKLCARFFGGYHVLGGRFLPDAMAKGLNLPPYPGSDQFVLLPHRDADKWEPAKPQAQGAAAAAAAAAAVPK